MVDTLLFAMAGSPDELLACMHLADTLISLPEELIRRVLLQLDGTSLASMRGVCKALHPLVDEDAWRAASLERWGWLFRAPTVGYTWASTYARLHQQET